MNTVSDDRPMTISTTATVIAGHPMCPHISLRLNPMLAVLSLCGARQASRKGIWMMRYTAIGFPWYLAGS